MYNILLVDDEPAILNGLSQTISWAEYGFDTVASASSAAQALALLHEQTFDIILTDICMPDMDGLTLIQTVRTLYPSISCIILTAYSEFDYALKALRLGVDNFLLKPVNPAELISTLSHTLERFEHSSAPAAVDNDSFIRNILQRWMNGTLSADELDSRAGLIGINLFCRNYCIAALKPLTATIDTSAVSESIRQTLAASFDCYALTDKYNCTFFILGGHSITSEKLFSLLQPFAQPNSHIFIGQTIENYKTLSVCYKNLQRMACYAALFDTESPICISTLFEKINPLKDSENMQRLQKLLQSHNSQNILLQVSGLIQNILDSASGNYRNTILAYLDCLLTALEKSNNTPDLVTDFLTSTVKTLLPLEDLKNPVEHLLHIFEETQRLLDLEYPNASPVTRRVIRFLKENYRQQVSLKTISRQFGVNPSYLGYLFKEETGVFFSDFLNNLRMQHAEDLLLHTDHTVSEIAEIVGYSTSTYFNQLFKKSHSLSPAKYRQTAKNIR